MKNKLILGLIAMVLLVTLSTAGSNVASNSGNDSPPCSAEFVPDSGTPYAEGKVPIEHNSQDCGMNHG